MTLLDSMRTERAVQSYGFWLDLRGASGRRRRELRRELRANLAEAAARSGAATAVRALGSTRQMAADAVPLSTTRPRWSSGVQAGASAVLVVIFLEVLASLAWLDGVLAADPGRPVTGGLTLFPGSSMTYAPVGEGFSLEFGPGWTGLVVGLVVLLAVARPWRALPRRAATQAATNATTVRSSATR